MFVKLCFLVVILAHLGTARDFGHRKPRRILAPACTYNRKGNVRILGMVPFSKSLYCKEESELYTVRGISCCKNLPKTTTTEATTTTTEPTTTTEATTPAEELTTPAEELTTRAEESTVASTDAATAATEITVLPTETTGASTTTLSPAEQAAQSAAMALDGPLKNLLTLDPENLDAGIDSVLASIRAMQPPTSG